MPMKVDDLEKYGNYTELEMKIAKFLEEHKGTAYTWSEIYESLNRKIEPRTWGEAAIHTDGLILYSMVLRNMVIEGKIKSHYAGGNMYFYL